MVEPRSGGSAEDDQRHTELLPPLRGSGRITAGDRGLTPTATCLGHSVAEELEEHEGREGKEDCDATGERVYEPSRRAGIRERRKRPELTTKPTKMG